MGFAQEGRDHRGYQEDHQPGRKHDQQAGERDQADEILADIQ